MPALPLGELHGTAAARLLGKLGATVRLQTKVAVIESVGGASAGLGGDVPPGKQSDGEFRIGLAGTDAERRGGGL